MTSLQDALSMFLQVDRAQQTNLNYCRLLSPFVEQVGPGRDVSLITYADLLDYTSRRRSGLAASSFRQHVITIKVLFNWLVRIGAIDQSPAASLTARKPTSLEHNRAVPGDVLLRAIDLAQQDSPRDYAVLLFLADTACRAGGIASLMTHNLHDLAALIREKGQRFYWVYYGEQTQAALHQWLRLRPGVEHDYVFTSSNPRDLHRPLSPDAYSSIVRAWTKRAGSRGYGAHAIRHWLADTWEQQGESINTVAQKLNHSSPRTTYENYLSRQRAVVQAATQRNALRNTPSSRIIYLEDDAS